MSENVKTEEAQYEGATIAGQPPAVKVTPGWQTSEAHLTLLFGVVASVLALLGFHYTPAQVGNAYDAVTHIAQTIGPIAAFLPVLFNYITSRGKTKSNAINATAQLHTLPAAAALGAMGLAGSGGAGGLLGAIIGGKDWKDPARYVGIARTAAEVGVPGVAKGVSLMDKVVGGPQGAADTYTKAEIEEVLGQFNARLAAIENTMRMRPLPLTPSTTSPPLTDTLTDTGHSSR